MKLKVCGLKYADNITAVSEAKPDFMGFIFYKNSTRYIGDDFVMPETKNTIKKVGVFVDTNEEQIVEMITKYSLDLIQLHGSETPEYCFKINTLKPVIKAFGINNGFDFNICNEYKNSCSYFLFDTKTETHGGSGIKFDWKILNNYSVDKPYFLSGGISIDDVAEIKKLNNKNLFAIDINSKFEIEPGIKNTELIKQFKNELSA